MTTIDEVAPDVFRISTCVPEADLQFGQFLVRDDEPLLFETGRVPSRTICRTRG
jgi:hypothetical protein